MLRHLHRISPIIAMLSLIAVGCSSSTQAPPIAAPTVTPIADWNKLQQSGLEIWLPSNFIGGTQLDIDQAAQRLSQLGPDFASQAETIKRNRENILAFAIDQQPGPSGQLTNVVIGKEVLRGDPTIEGYLATFARRLPSQYTILEQQAISLTRYPAGHLLAEFSTPQTGTIKQDLYVIRNGNVVWQFTFSTPANEFETRAEIFRTIIESATVPYSAEESNWLGSNYQGVVFVVGLILVVVGGILRTLLGRRKAPMQPHSK